MTSRWAINDFVRKRLRNLRLARGLSGKEFASRLGIPRTSYVSLETGAYNFKLDVLFKALAILEADIQDIWPEDREASAIAQNPLHLRRIQEFRLTEVVSLAEADGGCVLRLEGGSASVLMSTGLNQSYLERLCLYLEDGRLMQDGYWFERVRRNRTFYLYVKASSFPNHLQPVARHYMSVWASFFSGKQTNSESSPGPDEK